MQIDRNRALKKWSTIIRSLFNDVKYITPYIEEEIAYQLELKCYENYYIMSSKSTSDSDYKLPNFLKNIQNYIIETIPSTYLKLEPTCINKVLNIKSIQDQDLEIKNYLIEIDFNNTIDKLYDNDYKKYVRKSKLKKLSNLNLTY